MQALSDALLARYLAGECSADETLEIERWADESPAHRAQLEELRRIWNARRPARSWDTQEIWSNVQRTMRTNRRRPLRLVSDHTLGRERRSWGTRIAAIAAAILVIVSSAALLHIAATAKTPAAVAMREYVTPRGQRATVRLDDGTRVTLGAQSRLRWSEPLGARRDVYLDGEALFTVAHDPRRPFRVHVGDAVMQDLGTEFSVRGYADDGRVVVVVKSGQVAFSPRGTAASQPVVLDAGDLGAMSASGVITVQHDVDVDRYLAFAEGRLVFVDTPLGEVLGQLQRWYDVQFVVQDSALLSATVTASFQGAGLDDVLHALSASLDMRAERRGTMVWLRAR
ncbi:MAG: FecR domain-containing protein [Gemmatimonadaceae bacterium]|nr:FecR domain-containing protein [Gemmatimonadaceae bacterium]